jgi:hypothetical protein
MRGRRPHSAFNQFAAFTQMRSTPMPSQQGQLTMPVLAIGADKSLERLADDRFVATDVDSVVISRSGTG